MGRRTLQPKMTLYIQKFDLLLQESQYSDCHLQTVVDVDQIAVISLQGTCLINSRMHQILNLTEHLQLSQKSLINFLQCLLMLKVILYLNYIF